MRITKNQNVRMSRQERQRELANFVALCFAMLEDYTWEEMAKMTGLSLSTLYRIHKEGPSVMCRFNTIQVIGLAAGFVLFEDERGAPRMKLRKAG